MRNINLEDLKNWHREKRVLYAAASRQNKSLYCTLKGTYEVCIGKKVVHYCIDPLEAVEKYNNIVKTI